jgi:DNA-binding NarL/FixJ family response regulator
MNIPFAELSYTSRSGQVLDSPLENISRENTLDYSPALSGYPETLKSEICVISETMLFRTCLARCLTAAMTDFTVSSFANIEEWSQNTDQAPTKIMLLCANGQTETEKFINEGLDAILQFDAGARPVLISDIDQPSQMIAALNKGAKGYVPISLDLEIATGAIKLVAVGGTFIPASGLLSSRSVSQPRPDARPSSDLLTDRQVAVLEHLRRGDQNKIIAHKMNMSEATVKIHVRNMMKKLKAKNRTELVCLTNRLLGL